MRRSRATAVARPVAAATGRTVKDPLRAHQHDPGSEQELADLRRSMPIRVFEFRR